MSSRFDRRNVLIFLGSAAAAWPLAARAEGHSPIIGFLNSASPDPTLQRVAAFRKGLSEMGFERQNAPIEFRWAENQIYRLPGMAADLVRRHVTIIAATGSTASALAAKQATSTIPIVFEIGGDPIAAGLVDSPDVSGGNVTGVSLNIAALTQHQFELLREVFPKASTVAVFLNPDNRNSPAQKARVEAAARAVGLQTLMLDVSKESGFERPFMTLQQRGADALFVGNDPYFLEWRQEIVSLAAVHSMPTIYASRAFVVAGGLMSYGASLSDGYHQVGLYVGRILKGEKPSDLPVVNSTKFQFAINLTTAWSLGLNPPAALLSRADEVMQ
jgi:putative tryptophan/tyrosine transport system substrate-binding protein